MIAAGGLGPEVMAHVRERISVETASLMGLPEIYRMVCRDEPDPVLSALTPEDLLKFSEEDLVVLGR